MKRATQDDDNEQIKRGGERQWREANPLRNARTTTSGLAGILISLIAGMPNQWSTG
jgi:hypothetical protein